MTDRPKKHRATLRRWFGPHIRPGFVKYTSLVGEVTWASNNLHSLLMAIFGTIFPSEDGRKFFYGSNFEMAYELWHSLRSDDAQRAALKAVATHSPVLTTRLRKSVLWIVDSAGRLSEYRNDAIHTAFDYEWGKSLEFVPTVAGNPKRVEKLKRVGYARLFRTLIGDLNQLAHYANAVEVNSMKWGEMKPPALPKRPRLRSVLLVQKSPPATSSQTQRHPKQKRQRRPSRS